MVVTGIIVKTDIPALNIPDSGINLLACIVDDFALYPAELPMMLKRESLAVHLRQHTHKILRVRDEVLHRRA